MKIFLTCSDANSLRNFRGTLIRELRDSGHEVVAAAPSFSASMRAWCDSLGVITETTKIESQSLNPLRDLRGIGHLWRIVRRHKPEIVMGYTHKPALYTAYAGHLAGVRRVTMMVTGMGFGFEPGKGVGRGMIAVITRNLFRVGCRVCDTVIFHNRDNRDYFLRERLLRNSEKAVVVGGSGVDLTYFARQPFDERDPRELTFLLIARIVRYKGILEYALAAQALKSHYPGARFLLAGYRDSNPLTYSESEWRFIEENVTYVGHCKNVRALYRKADVYVLPSYGEGMPRTVLEAMASGRPIITTDTYGCRDTVDEGKNGHLVPIRQWKPLADAMKSFLTGKSSVLEMGAASYEKAGLLFDVGLVNRQMKHALGLQSSAEVIK